MLVRRAIFGFSLASALGFVLLTCGTCTRAEGTPIPHGTLELVAEDQWIAAGHDFDLGLHFELENGWHIYWINPGDSGEPPRVKWELPAGVTAGALQWPTPRRLGTPSIVDFGYQDAVTLIVPMHAKRNLGSEEPAKIAAQVKVLVCREMCIPGSAWRNELRQSCAGASHGGQASGHDHDAALRLFGEVRGRDALGLTRARR